MLTCLTFTDLSAQKAQEREIDRLERGPGRADGRPAGRAGRPHAAGDPRRADRPAEPGAAGRPHRPGAGPRGALRPAAPPCSSSTSTGSSRSTTRRGTPPATPCCGGSPDSWSRCCARWTPSPASAATSSSCSRPTSTASLHAVDIGARLVAELCRRPERAADGRRRRRQRRHLRLGRGRGHRRDPAQRGRHGDVPGQVARWRRAPRSSTPRSGGRSSSDRCAQRMLQSALDDRRIVVHYQPIVDLPPGGIVGLRGARPDHRATTARSCSPSAFIPVAEESGLVVPLGAQVLEMACREARRWRAEEPLDAPVDGRRQPLVAPVRARRPDRRSCETARARPASTRAACTSS